MVTDHKALVTLLKGNNKKNKTMFCRMFDRIIPYDFIIEHMPGAKIGRADHLSKHPVAEATRVSLYDNTFTVAKLRSITNSLGYQVQKTTGEEISKSKKLVFSPNEHKI